MKKKIILSFLSLIIIPIAYSQNISNVSYAKHVKINGDNYVAGMQRNPDQYFISVVDKNGEIGVSKTYSLKEMSYSALRFIENIPGTNQIVFYSWHHQDVDPGVFSYQLPRVTILTSNGDLVLDTSYSSGVILKNGMAIMTLCVSTEDVILTQQINRMKSVSFIFIDPKNGKIKNIQKNNQADYYYSIKDFIEHNGFYYAVVVSSSKKEGRLLAKLVKFDENMSIITSTKALDFRVGTAKIVKGNDTLGVMISDGNRLKFTTFEARTLKKSSRTKTINNRNPRDLFWVDSIQSYVIVSSADGYSKKNSWVDVLCDNKKVKSLLINDFDGFSVSDINDGFMLLGVRDDKRLLSSFSVDF